MSKDENMKSIVQAIRELSQEDIIDFFADNFYNHELFTLREIILDAIEKRTAPDDDPMDYCSWDRPNIGDLLDRGSSS